MNTRVMCANWALQATSICALVVLSACTSSPPRPVEAIARADAILEQAVQSNAASRDSANVERARQKQQASKAAAEKGDMALSTRLAQEAEVDAQLSMAEARAIKAEDSAKEVQAALVTLSREVSNPPAPAITTSP